MSNNLLKIQRAYLNEIYNRLPYDLEHRLPAIRENDSFSFKAFGEPCRITPEKIILGQEVVTGPEGILIALYARTACREPLQLHPLKSFKQIKDSMPHQGAFDLRSQKSLVPYVRAIQLQKKRIIEIFDGHENEGTGGDFSFSLYPLPKVPLSYIFYVADEEFPASVTCLFAANAELFMPVDGLADVALDTAIKIIRILTL